MRSTVCLVGASVLMVSWLCPRAAAADGLLRSNGSVYQPVRTAVEATVFEQVSTTTTEMAFTSAAGTNAAFVFPVPQGATVTGFWTYRDGQWESAYLNVEEPSTVDDIGSSSATADSVLNACGGANAFVIELPEQPDPVQIRLEYVQVLPYSFGQVTYDYPLAICNGAVAAPYESVELTLDVTSGRPLAGFSAPGFGAAAQLEELTSNHVRVTYSLTSFLPGEDFRFTYGVEQDGDLYVNLLTSHTRCAEDGYFLLIVEPVYETDESQAIPKSFTFVMDVSGSMGGYKIEQVRTGAKYFVDELNSQDFLNVVAFNDFVDPLFAAPQPATAANQQLARQFLDSQFASGSTDIHKALTTALAAALDESHARMVVLLTDGQPTAGITDPTAIVQQVVMANTSHAKIHTFGVGSDVNQALLTALATSNQGQAHFIAENDDITDILATFYASIDLPVLTDISLSFGNVAVYEVFPGGLTDLYAGSQLFVVGRYQAGGDTQGSLAGRRLDQDITYTYPLSFPSCAMGENEFLPCLWAKAKVDALITEIVQSGVEDPAKLDEVVQLAKRCGLQTEYTSYGVPNNPPGGGSYPSGYGSGDLELGACSSAGRPPSSAYGWALVMAFLVLLVSQLRSAARRPAG